jgi:hypothetical protein
MATGFPTLEQIEAKRSALLKKIAIGKQAEQELAKLEESVKALSALIDISEDIPSDTPDTQDRVTYLTAAGTRPKRVTNPLSEFAETAIRTKGKLHIDELMIEMIGLGWQATDDYKLNMKNVFNSLAVNKKFKNLGRNIWTLAEAKENEEPT